MKTITAHQFAFELGKYLSQVQYEEIIVLLANGQWIKLTALRPADLTDEILGNVLPQTTFSPLFELGNVPNHEDDVTQDPLYQLEGYDSDAPADLSQHIDQYLYGEFHP